VTSSHGPNDRFLINPTIPWRGREWLLRVELGWRNAVLGATAFGASLPLDADATNDEVW
jgi:hypothetical protein